LLEIPSRFFEHNAMPFLLLFFTVALSLCVVGLVVLALASILGSVRDDWKIKNPNENRVRETTDLDLALFALTVQGDGSWLATYQIRVAARQ
jgi:hypothetical protein